MAAPCPNCGEGLETPLACGACGVLLQIDAEPTPYEVLGLELSVHVDADDARRRLRRITRLVHPDFFALAGPEQLALAEAHNARLNAAYDLVTDLAARADWLVRHLGGPTQKELGAMPQTFLMEVMEWNEVLEDNAPGSPCLVNLSAELRGHRADLAAAIEASLDPLPAAGAAALADVRKNLNALRYVDRALARAAGRAVPI